MTETTATATVSDDRRDVTVEFTFDGDRYRQKFWNGDTSVRPAVHLYPEGSLHKLAHGRWVPWENPAASEDAWVHLPEGL
jgi:hypothetical protein